MRVRQSEQGSTSVKPTLLTETKTTIEPRAWGYFPGETFRVLKEKEEREGGEYHTRHLVLEAWDKLEAK